MDVWFSKGYPLVYSIFNYLTIQDLGQWRQTSKKSQTTDYTGDWLQYVQREFCVRKCAMCDSIRSLAKMEWCQLCESWICIEHLDRCQGCHGVWCSSCTCDCRWSIYL